MTKNPLLNALTALGYIVLVVLTMDYFSGLAGHTQQTLLVPIALLSLLTLSAAVMSYIFLLVPLRLYLDGKKKPAVELFLKTIGLFAVMTLIVLVVAVSINI